LTFENGLDMDCKAFAISWEKGWNSHNLDEIMVHYRDDIVFRSLKAIPLVGDGEIRGKKALREYWAAALKRQQDLKFTLQDVFEGHEMMVISYLNHKGILATETLYFDADGMVFQAAACHRSR
jgi:ketosteroid isomerase-like protein